jgi:prophage antirepressor-like protein
VPLQSTSEFEAVLGQVLIKIDKHTYQYGEDPALKEAKRMLEKIINLARDDAKLKSLRDDLNAASEVTCAKLSRDEEVRNDLWDALDFIDYGL